MKTIKFKDVYVKSSGSAVGPMEAAGPLHDTFDITYDSLYCNEKNFERAEQRLVLDACEQALKKANCTLKDLSIVLGSDLNNQLASSHYATRHFNVSFVGMYGACSNSSLLLAHGAMWIEKGMDNVLCFTSSHNAVAEKQFRYPNEYGIQKKQTTTYTVTGAGAIMLTNEKSCIQVHSATIGKIVDWDFKDVNDMGKAMAPAAFETICAHLENSGSQIKDYDLVLTGDLSKNGLSFLIDMFVQEGFILHNNVFDCGLCVYDVNMQEVYAGGSGCACSMVVSIAYVYERLKKKELNRVLVVATGALLSPILVQQKESIPCIAHAIEYVRCE